MNTIKKKKDKYINKCKKDWFKKKTVRRLEE